MSVGTKLKQLRVMNNMTQSDLADMLGVTYQQVQKYESGANSLGIERLQVVCGLFRVDFDYFLGETVHRGGALSDEELGILKQFRIADDNMKAAVKVLLNVHRR